MEVERTERGIVKLAYTDADRAGLANEARMLRLLSGSGYAPELYEERGPELLQEDLGDGEPIQDGERFRQECCRLLWELRVRGIRHGDLTGANIIVRGDRPYAIDFQESNLYSEGPSQKRPQSDSYHLLSWAAQQPAEQHPTPDTPRILRRWLAVLESLGGFGPDMPLRGKSLLDLGCFQGDFTALAAAEGMEALGIDRGTFRSEGDSIAWAQELWGGMVIPPVFEMPGCRFRREDVASLGRIFRADVILLFSTWPYVLHEHGSAVAFELLENCIRNSNIAFFFETQLAGDGPGLSFLQTDEDVRRMLKRCGGNAEVLVTVPVTGRDASRTVWKVTAS